MSLPVNTIICGAMPEATKGFPGGYFNCCISSPPYWALRDYGVDGQLGLEKTFEEYIDKLCTIYDEVKRILRPDGTVFVNLGDTYGGSWGNYGGREGKQRKQNVVKFDRAGATPQDFRPGSSNPGIPAKSLCLIPQRFAIEMVNRGWILRNVIIWHKPNPMPSSAKDRFTVDFEYVYFFVKNKRYWFEPQYEGNTHYIRNITENDKAIFGGNGYCGPNKANRPGRTIETFGRNKRTVWTIPTQPFPEAHFATFPEKLVEPMIKAGCPEFVCAKCGKTREKIYNRPKPPADKFNNTRYGDDEYAWNMTKDGQAVGMGQKLQNWLNENPKTFKGYTDCGCNAEWRGGVVLDPFAGSGTVGQVAARLRRDYILIDLKQEYCEMAKKRVTQGETSIPVKEQCQGQQPLFPTKND